MAYTVVSLFPVAKDPQEIANKLLDHGFSTEDINISKYNIEGELVDDMEEDEQTKNFWDYLFGDTKWRSAYQKAGLDNNTVTVYANNIDQAKIAKSIMDECGALDINKFRNHELESDESFELSEDEESRIIAKAKHNVYFLNGTRTYKPNSRGMNKRMDYMGSKD